VDDSCVGRGYGIPTEEGLEAIRVVARTEGVLLDPTYSGKVMSGLIRLIHQQHLDSDSRIVFLHSGGGPILFARSSFLSSDARIETI